MLARWAECSPTFDSSPCPSFWGSAHASAGRKLLRSRQKAVDTAKDSLPLAVVVGGGCVGGWRLCWWVAVAGVGWRVAVMVVEEGGGGRWRVAVVVGDDGGGWRWWVVVVGGGG
ncbi:hypothetical protein L1987_11552 [Smallanthus sonchifolius]|uniref:Uncharacterized protein n=1 Tax=Smallanthus sonchifolius TaxID=185202 RepID=A0ACB9JBS7_9ASTR|nr:hypothetical protein L1987_11552 [Smallanthus sonchifolius]